MGRIYQTKAGRTYMQRLTDVAAGDSTCRGLARAIHAMNLAYAEGRSETWATEAHHSALKDRCEELGLNILPGYYGVFLAALCGRVMP